MDTIQTLLPRSYYPFFGRFAQVRPAQEKAIPSILNGQNIILISPTGSGKTEAVVAPTIEMALDAPGTLFCLYICPTRALVNDIERRVEPPLYKLNLRAGVRHGDRKTLRGNTVPSLLITTPESLDVMLDSDNEQREKLRDVRVVIIDEAHQFYQTHRGYQLIILLERLKHLTKAPLQRLLLSATVSQPDEMAHWFQGSDGPFEIIQIPGQRKLNVTLDLLSARTGKEYSAGESVVDAVREVTHEHAKVLLFANSRSECDWLYWKLHDQVEAKTFLHYSTLDRRFRERVEHDFLGANRALCIATSTLELGVDIGDIDAVAMYGAPSSISSFVQRIGRGNRRSGNSVVYGFCREYNPNGTRRGAEADLIIFFSLVASMRHAELETPSHLEAFSVYVQQFFSLTQQYESVIVDVLSRSVESLGENSSTQKTDLERILTKLASLGFFSFQPSTKAYYPTEKWEEIKRNLQIWGNIAQKAYDTVLDSDKSVPISQVPRGRLRAGQVFLLAGEPRMVTQVTGGTVTTLRLATNDPQIMSYEATAAATPKKVMQRAQLVLQAPIFPDLPIEIDDALSELMRAQRKLFRNLDFNRFVPYQDINGKFCYYTFAGTWANKLLGMILQSRGVKVTTDGWRVYTDTALKSFSDLLLTTDQLAELVNDNLSWLIRRMDFSYHFYQLPQDLQAREVCSILDIKSLGEWLAEFCQKQAVELTKP